MPSEFEKKMTGQMAYLNRQPVVACGHQLLTVTGATAQSLTVPSGAKFAQIRVISATVDGSIIMYCSQYGATTAPVAGAIGTGGPMPLAYMDYLELDGGDNISNFKVIVVSGTHYLGITYFK